MNIISTVISNIVENGFRKIKARVLGVRDIRTATQIAPFGVDSVPPAGMTGIYANTSTNGKQILIGYYNKSLLAQDGEFRIYSVDEDGSVATFIWLKANGKIQLGGDEDNAVRFSDLKSGFDQLKQDFNDHLTAFNAHMHATAASGPPSPPTPGTGIPAVASGASIDAAKIEEIQTP